MKRRGIASRARGQARETKPKGERKTPTPTPMGILNLYSLPATIADIRRLDQ